MLEGHGEPTLTSIQSPGGHVILIDNRIGLNPADEVLTTLARRGTDEGYTVLSDFMTGEPPEKRAPRLYICTLLRPGVHISYASVITAMAAVAAARAIERNSTLKKVSIRWPSDLYAERRFIGRVTVQSTLLPSGYPDFLVLRTEINMPPSLFPTRLSDVVAAVFANRKLNTADHIAQMMMRDFFGMYEQAERGSVAVIEEYKRRSLLLGRSVRIRKDGRVHRATATTVDKEGHLTLTLRDGTQHTLTMRSELL